MGEDMAKGAANRSFYAISSDQLGAKMASKHKLKDG
jgi:hypothetical protein